MGSDKALLRLPDGRALIERIVEVVTPLCSEVLLVADRAETYAFLGLPSYPDAYPGLGPLGGVCAGLAHARYRRALMLSCDLPLLEAKVLRYLIGLPLNGDAIVPLVGGRPQPLHAIYAKSALPSVREQIAARELKLARLLGVLRVQTIGEEELFPFDPEMRSFRNVNTPAEWSAALRLIEAQRKGA